MDGFELCDKLKNDMRISHIPIIMLTAKATSKDKIEGYETGADDYVIKPFDARVLKARVKNLINQRKKLREFFLKEGILSLENSNITSMDKKFLEKIYKIINENLSDSSFGIESFASKIALGRATLHKKLVALIGEPPSELVKRVRLNKAAKLIEKKFGNISEIALEVGFSNPAYFSDCFRKQFGVSPSIYRQNITKD
jgi:AraC-like DNA-binding protein